ncbi:rhodanese-like domain-containing protein [Alginatibacterium sediminis]|nr:rhodanese-like domain-containing protein [Alginatibacterium sediminis]
MKPSFLALLLLVVSALGQAQENMSQWLNEGQMIDVRTLQEYQSGHMRGAVNIPYDQIQLQIAAQVPDKSTPVLLYCRSGRRSGIAQQSLIALGYKNVVNIGGIEELQEFVAQYAQ